MPPKEDVSRVLAEIEKYCEHIAHATHRFGNSFESFNSDEDYQASCVFALFQIGENVKKIEPWLNTNSDRIPWSKIIRFRDFAGHHYTKADMKVVWSIIEHNVPELWSEILRLKEMF